MTTPTDTALPVESGLVVTDADRSVAFYSAVLGFEEFRRVELGDFTRKVGLGEPGRLVWTRSAAGQVLKFYDGGAKSDYSPPNLSGSWAIHHFITAYVANLETALATAISSGATRLTEIETLETGVRVAFLRDPDGHVVEIVQRPGVTP